MAGSRGQVGSRGEGCACAVGRWTGTGRDRDCALRWEGWLAGWVNQDDVGVLIPGVGLLPSHAHTLVPFGAVEYCYFRKGGFLVSHT